MTTRRRTRVLAGCAVLAVIASGCGKPSDVPSGTSSAASSSAPAPAASPPASATAPNAVQAPGKVVGTATLTVLGTGRATVTWRANGGPERTENNVALPWERTIDVIEKADSTVGAVGANGCTITMDGKLVAYQNEPNPLCEFAYWG